MAKKNAGKKAKGATTVSAVNIKDVSNARIVMTLEKAAKLETTPQGSYTVETPIGTVTISKSEAGRITWKLDGTGITRSNLYNQMKDAGKKPTKEEKPAKKGKDKKAGKKSKEKEVVEGPAKAVLEAEYKKKQFINVLKTGAWFKKGIIKKIANGIEEKKASGSVILATITDVIADEPAVETINAIFEALKK